MTPISVPARRPLFDRQPSGGRQVGAGPVAVSAMASTSQDRVTTERGILHMGDTDVGTDRGAADYLVLSASLRSESLNAHLAGLGAEVIAAHGGRVIKGPQGGSPARSAGWGWRPEPASPPLSTRCSTPAPMWPTALGAEDGDVLFTKSKEASCRRACGLSTWRSSEC